MRRKSNSKDLPEERRVFNEEAVFGSFKRTGTTSSENSSKSGKHIKTQSANFQTGSNIKVTKVHKQLQIINNNQILIVALRPQLKNPVSPLPRHHAHGPNYLQVLLSDLLQQIPPVKNRKILIDDSIYEEYKTPKKFRSGEEVHKRHRSIRKAMNKAI